MKVRVEANSRTWNMGTEYGEYTADIMLCGKVFSFAGSYALPENGGVDISVSMHTEKGWRAICHKYIYDVIADEIEGYNVVWTI